MNDFFSIQKNPDFQLKFQLKIGIKIDFYFEISI